MARCARWLGLVLLGCLWGPAASGQAVLDLGSPASVHTLAARRAYVLEEAREGAAKRLVAVAGAVGSTSRGGADRMRLLGEAQELSDSVARLDEELAGARAELAQARRRLILALDGEADSLRRAAQDTPLAGRPAVDARVRALEAELAGLRGAEADPTPPHPLDAASAALSRLAGVAEEEGARLRAARALQEELRLFMGYLRVFDETGVPPSARAESGGTGEPGCPVSTCPTDVAAAPADLPLEHARPEGGGVGGGDPGVSVTPASLDELRDRLRARSAPGPFPAAHPDRVDGAVARDLGFGLALMGFRRQGDSQAGVAVRSAATLRTAWAVGATSRLTLEPWVGARSVRVSSASSGEVTAELREILDGGREDRVRWQVASWQRGRVLAEALPLPAYLGPGRAEGGLMARASIPCGPAWAMEVGAGADGVRYQPASWKVLNRQGLNGSAAVSRQAGAGSVRVSLQAARHSFPSGDAGRRADTRLAVGADGSLEGRRLLRISVGMTRNDSSLPAYDYGSARAAVTVSAPWGSGSVQAYGALSLLRYDHPGPADRRVAPSDQDMGSMVALQATRPVGASRTLGLRAEWARSVTGFGSDYYQRFGASAQVSFRASGER